ncbi:MAG: hypothetical protein IKK00_06885 [Oscillospiraceae bacterium]|nr:hypothetical protein [Oscillospiraceae bacterium]
MIIKTKNGKREYEYTEDELALMEADARRVKLEEARRPLTESEVLAMLIPQQINTLDVDDNTALRMKDFYPEWAADTAYTTGFKVKHGGKLWRVIQAHTSLTGWEPENAASLYEQINETHSGTIDDPIPYSGNMALTAGLYYMQGWEIYLCTRDTVSPVYHPLSELVGLYVEKA